MGNLENYEFRGNAGAGGRRPFTMLRPSAIMMLRFETHHPTTLPAVHPERRDRFLLGTVFVFFIQVD